MKYHGPEWQQFRDRARANAVERSRAAPRPAWGRGHPAISDRHYTEAEAEFIGAMERYIRESGRRFPTWSEVLEVAVSLGYRKAGGAGRGAGGAGADGLDAGGPPG